VPHEPKDYRRGPNGYISVSTPLAVDTVKKER